MGANQRRGDIQSVDIQSKIKFGKDEVVDPVFPLYLNMTLYGETAYESYGSRAAQYPGRVHAVRPLGINTRPVFCRSIVRTQGLSCGAVGQPPHTPTYPFPDKFSFSPNLPPSQTKPELTTKRNV